MELKENKEPSIIVPTSTIIDDNSPTSLPESLNTCVDPFVNLVFSVFLVFVEIFFSCCLGSLPLEPFILTKTYNNSRKKNMSYVLSLSALRFI